MFDSLPLSIFLLAISSFLWPLAASILYVNDVLKSKKWFCLVSFTSTLSYVLFLVFVSKSMSSWMFLLTIIPFVSSAYHSCKVFLSHGTFHFSYSLFVIILCLAFWCLILLASLNVHLPYRLYVVVWNVPNVAISISVICVSAIVSRSDNAWNNDQRLHIVVTSVLFCVFQFSSFFIFLNTHSDKLFISSWMFSIIGALFVGSYMVLFKFNHISAASLVLLPALLLVFTVSLSVFPLDTSPLPIMQNILESSRLSDFQLGIALPIHFHTLHNLPLKFNNRINVLFGPSGIGKTVALYHFLSNQTNVLWINGRLPLSLGYQKVYGVNVTEDEALALTEALIHSDRYTIVIDDVQALSPEIAEKLLKPLGGVSVLPFTIFLTTSDFAKYRVNIERLIRRSHALIPVNYPSADRLLSLIDSYDSCLSPQEVLTNCGPSVSAITDHITLNASCPVCDTSVVCSSSYMTQFVNFTLSYLLNFTDNPLEPWKPYYIQIKRSSLWKHLQESSVNVLTNENFLSDLSAFYVFQTPSILSHLCTCLLDVGFPNVSICKNIPLCFG
ncbi:hypothetical protein RCL1_004950 [Eukaryota sp. TZLM3-RCL]